MKKKNCTHEILTRRHLSYWWVCYHCRKSLSPEQVEKLKALREKHVQRPHA